MEFYVSWYHGDPVYPLYDPDCSMLVSISSVSNRWKVTHLPTQPKSIMIDSGGYRFATTSETPPTPTILFKRQLEMLAGSQCRAIICALDYPIVEPNLSSNERDRLLHQTIANAYEFKQLIQQTREATLYESLVVIQGYDVPSLSWCANELKHIGFDRYGVGSLAVLTHYKEMTRRIHAVVDVVGPDIHIFGVSATQMIERLLALNIHSIDSSTPIKSAMFNQIFYSNPFRRIQLARNSDERAAQQNAYEQELEICSCPICNGTANIELLEVGKKRFSYKRAVHNYFHLKQTVTQTQIT